MTLQQQQQQRRRQSGHNSRYESEGGCDAISPRDKKHAAAASRADSGSVPSSSAPSSSNLTPPPGGISLNGRAISAVTGSAVAEFYVDSPVVKLGRAGGSNKQQRGSCSIDPMRLGVDLGAGSALRSSWKQAQLLRPK
jgi:type II secretory pathway pseudopilin PulG